MSGLCVVQRKSPITAILVVMLMSSLVLTGFGAASAQAAGTGGPLEDSLFQEDTYKRLQPKTRTIATGPEGIQSVETLPEQVAASQPSPRESLALQEPAQRQERDPSAQVSLNHENCLPHPSIRITEDEGPNGFALVKDPVTGTAVSRPGSGVLSGSGTEDDPYVIEGWCIGPTVLFWGPFEHGIQIEHTSAHVVIRHNTIGSLYGPALKLENAENVRFENNEVLDTDWGVVADGTRDLSIQDNRFDDIWNQGVTLESTTGTRVEGNDFTDLYEAVYGLSNHDLVISSNQVESNWFGFFLAYNQGLQMTHNQIEAGTGAYLENVWDTTIHANTFVENYEGIYLRQHRTTDITSNTFTDNQAPMFSYNGLDLHIGSNTITSGRIGIDSYSNRNVLIDSNTITGTDYAIYSDDADDVTIAHNELEGNLGGILAGRVRSDLTIADNKLVDNGWYGVYVNAYWGNHAIVVEDNLFDSNGLGVYLDGGIGVVHGNTFSGHSDAEIVAYGLSGGSITGNEIRDTPWSYVLVYSSDNMLIADNDLHSEPTDGQDWLVLWASKSATINGNTLARGGLVLDGYSSLHFEHAVDDTNTVGGQPILYLNGAEEAVVDQDAAQVILVASHDAQITGLNFVNSPLPILIANSDDVVIEDTSINAAAVGLYAFGSDRLQVQENTIQGAYVGVYLQDTTDAHVQGNLIEDTEVGVGAVQTNGLLVEGNTILNGDGGVFALASRDATITGNQITGQTFAGIVIFESRQVTVEHNQLEQNEVGIGVIDSRNTEHRFNELSGNTLFGFAVAGEFDGGGHLLNENNIHGNTEAGVYADSSHTLDARENWWGCSNGPGEPGCDGVEGDVDTSDWLASPVPDAGT